MRRRQPLAPFGAAPFQHQSPVFGRHSGTKAMCLCTPTIVWLECALWHRWLRSC